MEQNWAGEIPLGDSKIDFVGLSGFYVEGKGANCLETFAKLDGICEKGKKIWHNMNDFPCISFTS